MSRSTWEERGGEGRGGEGRGGEGRGGEGKMEEENNSKKVYMYVHVHNFCPSCDILFYLRTYIYLLYFTYIYIPFILFTPLIPLHTYVPVTMSMLIALMCVLYCIPSCRTVCVVFIFVREP